MNNLLSSNLFKSFKEPNIIVHKKIKKLLKKKKKVIIKKVGKKNYTEFVKNKTIPRNMKIQLANGKCVKAKKLHKVCKISTAVHSPFRDDNHPSAYYYPDTNKIHDFTTSISYTIKSKKVTDTLKITVHKLKDKYIDSTLIDDKSIWVRLILAPTGTGKTTAVKKMKGTKILLVPTLAIAENIHDPEHGVYYLQALEHSFFDNKNDNDYVSNIRTNEVTVVTYDKYVSMVENNLIPKDAKIIIDEVHNLINGNFRTKTTAKLEEALKGFKSITYLSATMNHKYIANLDEVIQFKHNNILQVLIVKNSDMYKYINFNDDSFHVIFNEDSYQNIEAQKKYGGLNVFSKNTDDIIDSDIADDVKFLFCTTAMKEGVSLRVSDNRKVYVHITKATAASDVLFRWLVE